jgi:hypothetical protein
VRRIGIVMVGLSVLFAVAAFAHGAMTALG